MTGKEILRDLRKMTLESRSMKTDIELLRQEAEGLRATELSDMPRGGVRNDASDLIVELVDLQKQRSDLTEDRRKKHERTLLAIAKVEDNDEREVLTLRYALAKSWDDVAESMGYSVRNVYKIHGFALASFSKIYGANESVQ